MVALVRDSVPRTIFATEGLAARVTTVQGCLEDLPLLRRTLSEYSIRTVFHLAAQPLVGVAKANPVGTLQANVMGTWNVLESARLAGVSETVIASSDKAYGISPDLPYLETHPLRGTFPYDVSKSCADLISTMYAETYALPVAILRCANLFGGGDLNFSRTIPGVIQSTLNNEQFRIRSDGTCIRDFLYVKDAARAYLHCGRGFGAASGTGWPGLQLQHGCEVDCAGYSGLCAAAHAAPGSEADRRKSRRAQKSRTIYDLRQSPSRLSAGNRNMGWMRLCKRLSTGTPTISECQPKPE